MPTRVMRGLRLSHLAYVGDELYQLMLQCWQLDLDERPTFQEIITVLENILEGVSIYIFSNANRYIGKKCECFDNCLLLSVCSSEVSTVFVK